MKTNLFSRIGLLTAACVFLIAGRSVAVDLAEAAGVMAEIEAMAVSAKAAIADAAVSGGDVVEAQTRADAIDAAVAQARDAFSNMELSIQSGDMDAADTAEDELAAALVLVRDALMGAIPEAMTDAGGNEGAAGQQQGTPGDPDDPPNIHEVPWKSQGIKAYYQSLFGDWWNASAFGHGRGFGDGDATPE